MNTLDQYPWPEPSKWDAQLAEWEGSRREFWRLRLKIDGSWTELVVHIGTLIDLMDVLMDEFDHGRGGDS